MLSLRVLLVAADPLARAGLSALLSDTQVEGPGSEIDVDVVLQLAADDVQQLGRIDEFDVALWDLGWEAPADLGELAELVEMGLPVVVLAPAVEVARPVWTTGVRGLLPRDVAAASMVAALHAATHGLLVLDPTIAASMPLFQADLSAEALVEALTPRELEVLQLLAEGEANKAIARRLAISENTVKYHVNAILGKLGAQSRTEAVVRATRMGLILL